MFELDPSIELTPPDLGYNGFCSGISLSDLIQVVCLQGEAMVLSVTADEGSGRIFMESGEVVHAEAGPRKGEEAFYEIMCWSRGTFVLGHGASPEKSVAVPLNFLLIEALRQRDEAASGRTVARGKPEILLVDDSTFFKNRLKRLLQNEMEAEVAGDASNGQEALKILQGEQHPDLVLLDLNMPVMGGDVALKHIMIRSPSAVALLSSFAPSDTPKLMEFFRLGAVDFISKPGTDEDEWQLFVKRLKGLCSRAKGFNINGIRRARLPRPPAEKHPPGLPAQDLTLLIGGKGGLLELQKILPVLGHNNLLQDSLVVFQDICPVLVPHIADFFDMHCSHSVRQIKAGAPLLSGQIWFTGWDQCWDMESDDAGAAVVASDLQDPEEGLNSFLSAAAEIFRDRLTVVLLSGADLKIDLGLDALMGYGGHLVVQVPATAVCPAPLQRLMDKELEERALEPEEIAGFICNDPEGAGQS